jgi:DNA-binding transcriptional regulator YiaG
MKNEYESEILQVVHEDMKGMHQLGIINDSKMREFDEMCLAPETDAGETSAVQKTKTERADFITA